MGAGAHLKVRTVSWLYMSLLPGRGAYVKFCTCGGSQACVVGPVDGGPEDHINIRMLEIWSPP